MAMYINGATHACQNLFEDSNVHCQNINSSDPNALMALKGDGSWHSHWFIARYAQTTPTGN